jgi:hypothetical protein
MLCFGNGKRKKKTRIKHPKTKFNTMWPLVRTPFCMKVEEDEAPRLLGTNCSLSIRSSLQDCLCLCLHRAMKKTRKTKPSCLFDCQSRTSPPGGSSALILLPPQEKLPVTKCHPKSHMSRKNHIWTSPQKNHLT